MLNLQEEQIEEPDQTHEKLLDMISCQPKVCSSFIVYGICYLPRGVYTTHYLGGVSHTLLVLQTSGVVQPILSLGMIFLDTLNELRENGQYSLKMGPC